MKSLGQFVVAAGLAVAAAATAHAHHSFGAFDLDTEIELTGDVVEFRWTGPHTWTRLDVTNEDGSVTQWALEGMGPDYLGRRGWTRDTLGSGDTITVVASPLKNGEPGGMFRRCTLEDGTVKVMFGR